MDENKKKISDFFTETKEALKDPKKKAVIFFGAYFVFFAILLAILRMNTTSTQKKVPTNISSDTMYSLENIKKKNYRFIYEIDEDKKQIIIDGERYNDGEMFTVKENNQITSYYKNSKEILKKNNNEWVETDNPIEYYYILDIDTLESIFTDATYISKTEYQNKNVDLNYEVSTATLCKLLDNKVVDIEDSINKIVIKTDKTSEVEEINLDLSPYFSYINNRDSDITFRLAYSDIGDIEEILNPQK